MLQATRLQCGSVAKQRFEKHSFSSGTKGTPSGVTGPHGRRPCLYKGIRNFFARKIHRALSPNGIIRSIDPSVLSTRIWPGSSAGTFGSANSHDRLALLWRQLGTGINPAVTLVLEP